MTGGRPPDSPARSQPVRGLNKSKWARGNSPKAKQLLPLPGSPKARGRLLHKMARSAGTVKQAGVSYSPSPVKKVRAHSGSGHDLSLRGIVVGLYKRRVSASPTKMTADSPEGSLAIQEIARAVLPDKMQDKRQRNNAVKFVRNWARKFDLDPEVDPDKNKKGAGGRGNRGDEVTASAKKQLRKAIKQKKTRTVKRALRKVNMDRLKKGKRVIKSHVSAWNVLNGTAVPVPE